MRQTLFHIPPELFGVSVLGIGWALAVWLGVLVVFFILAGRRQGFAAAAKDLAPYAVIGGLVIVFLLPRIEEQVAVEGVTQNLGLPVRGYGVLMFVGVVSGVALAVRRAAGRGIHQDYVYGLAMWMFIAGFAGARLFFVYQYRDSFHSETWADFFGNLVNIAEGGLVVYGSLIGALIAYSLFVWRHRLPPLVFADILAPSMLLGLAIGRLGCLLNGCCYGGPAEYPWAVCFPPESPPYMEQLQTGSAQGIHLVKTDDHETIVDFVLPGGPAAEAGLETGTTLLSINGQAVSGPGGFEQARQAIAGAAAGSQIRVATPAGELHWTAGLAPPRSLPTHPAQIYSSLNALILFAFILAVAPWQRRDGALLALTLTLYPLARFLLEIVRQDEPAVNGLGLTISQSISLGILAAAAVLWILVWRQPVGKQVAKLA